MSSKTQRVDLDEPALEGLIARVTEAKEHNLALSTEDIQLLLDALMTLAHMQERLQDNDITLHKLRKLLGIVKSSEKLSGLLSNKANQADKPQSPAKNKSSKPKSKTPKKKITPKTQHHKLTDVQKGDLCPKCEAGKLYKYEPARFFRVSGSSPLTPTLHVSERLRCNACGQFFTASLPEAVLADGGNQQKYGYSARSVMAINKYYGGTPFQRQESLQSIFGMPVSASTIFDQCEYVANACHPIFQALTLLASEATHYHVDDTHHRILDQQGVMKKRRNSEKEQWRTGTYSSGLIAQLDNDQEIILFNTNIGHAGEFLDDILKQRAPGLPPPLVMSDALSSNHVTLAKVIRSLCNAHGRRQFVDVFNHFPDEVAWVLEQYALIWENEQTVLEQALNDQQRLEYHKENSLPVMIGIKEWGQNLMTTDVVEENSGLGKAIAYFDRHFEGLTRFCTCLGAQLDNNVMERQLKLIVRNRKNANFFKTLAGAAIGDVLTSIIATAANTNVNVFEYLNAIQRHQTVVKEKPLQWLPWNFEQNTAL